MCVFEFIKRRDLGKSSDVQRLRTTFSSAHTRKVYSIRAFNRPKRIISLLLIIIRRKNNIMTSKFSSSNNAVRRISQEVKEFLDSERQMEDGNEDQQKDGSKMMDNNAFATWAEPLEDDIFEWHFAIYGAEGARERI